MTERDVEKAAQAIVDDLFMNGNGDRAERLVLTADGPPRRDLGGWSSTAVLHRIKRLLTRELAR